MRANPASRPLPVRLDVSQSWSTWLPLDAIPPPHRSNAYAMFRVRLSSGEVHASTKDDTVPPIGSVAGGPIDSRDLE